MKSRWMCVVLILVGATAGSHAEELEPGAALAERYGWSGWDQIEQIDFTFNVQLPGKDEPVVRRWEWDINAGERGEVRRITERAELDFEVYHFNLGDTRDLAVGETKQVHQQFINDTYWLLFPFQLVWSDPEVTEAGPAPLPIGDGRAAQKLVCQWPAAGGYTPGDAYDLYVGDDGLIQQWVFRKGGKPAGNAHTWEDHQQLGPIIVSLDHRNADGTFRLWFTDVKATLTDGTTVMPEPLAGPGVEAE